jgi:hypothetical protein
MKILVKHGIYYNQELINETFEMRSDKIREKDGIKTVEIILPNPTDNRRKYATITITEYELLPGLINSKNDVSQIDLEKLEIEVRSKFEVMEQLYQAVFQGAIKSA